MAIVCIAAFLWWDWRPENPAPVLHLRTVWRHAQLRTSLAIVTVVGAILGSRSVRAAAVSADRAGLQCSSDGRFRFGVHCRVRSRPADFITLCPATARRTKNWSALGALNDVRCPYQLRILHLDADYSNVAPRALDLSTRVFAVSAVVGRFQHFHERGGSRRFERYLHELFFCSTNWVTRSASLPGDRHDSDLIAKLCIPHVCLMWRTVSIQHFSQLYRNTPV